MTFGLRESRFMNWSNGEEILAEIADDTPCAERVVLSRQELAILQATLEGQHVGAPTRSASFMNIPTRLRRAPDTSDTACAVRCAGMARTDASVAAR